MTPFDVLKTRLQTVQPSPRIPYVPLTEECCQTSVLTPKNASAWSSRIPQSNLANPLTCLTSAATSSRPTVNPTSRSLVSSVRSTSATAAAPDGCLHPSKWAGIWGEAITLDQALARGMVGVGSGGGATFVPEAAEQAVTGVIGGFWNEVAAVRRETGVRGLWKGVGTTLYASTL